MQKEQIQSILEKQKAFFASGATLPLEQRIRKLRRLQLTAGCPVCRQRRKGFCTTF